MTAFGFVVCIWFRANGGSVAEKSRLACASGAAILALPSIPVRFARAVGLNVPGVFFSSLWMLCSCVLHVLRYLVHWNCCIKVMCSTVVCRNCAQQLSLCRSQWNGSVNQGSSLLRVRAYTIVLQLRVVNRIAKACCV